MAEPLGSFCLVLHGHLPYVLRHGQWPHGEDWLYEAAAETYLPLLALVDECVYLNASPRFALGLTPVLLEQLAHDDFKDGFERYLANRVERAQADQSEFQNQSSEQGEHLSHLADRWAQWYTQRAEQFSKINRDLPKAFAKRALDGHIELLTSNATHGYMPLLLEDSSIRAQIRAGLASSERLLGFKPKGMWLPECAYRPGGRWQPPVAWGQASDRKGIEHLIADEGITHFFSENHLVEQSRSEWVTNEGQDHKVSWDEAINYPARGWRNVHEPHRVNSDGSSAGNVTVFARDPRICEQVWSGSIGYPGAGEYLEFHKKHGERRGLRYWKVTGTKVDLADKHLYHPGDIEPVIHRHAAHFCQTVKQRLRDYRQQTGRHGVVTACFDAELFGHWWYEGPEFLRDVILTLSADPEIQNSTTAEYLSQHPPDKTVALPEGSWGEGGDHRVWINEQTRWIWEVEYRAESLFGKLTYQLPWEKPENSELRSIMEKAGRELLLMQASDWPFVISRGQAIDYGIKRFVLHAGRFENLCDIAEKLARNEELTDLERFEIQDSDLHDVIFPDIDLSWWSN
jgi:1,4-alpha-glucan branching enzyme